MKLSLIASCSILFLSAVPSFAVDPQAMTSFDGKVKRRIDVEKKADPAELILVSKNGMFYTIIKDASSNLLFLDEQLLNRDIRLTAHLQPDKLSLKIEKLQTIKDGKIFDVDYWCDQCQFAAKEAGKCLCCGSDTVLRERPAK